MYDGKDILADCEGHVDMGSTMEWAIVVDSHLTQIFATDPMVTLGKFACLFVFVLIS